MNQQNPGTLIRFFKNQGDDAPELHQYLKKDDFVLIIINKSQLEILRKFGNNIVCMDDTHGLNFYGFALTTLLVIDDLNEGFPTAFMFSNRVDTEVSELFLTIIKESLQESLKPNVFMSDMAESFYNAWKNVMEPAGKQLFCTWHVDKAWKKNLNKIRSKEKQDQTYKTLRTLLETLDEEAFKIMLKQFVLNLEQDPDTVDFGTYFRDNYYNCAGKWAYCHRKKAGINTNMSLERVHGVMKHIT